MSERNENTKTKNISKRTIILGAFLVLIGSYCAHIYVPVLFPQVPRCSDPETIKLAEKIVTKTLSESMGASLGKTFSTKISSIRTTDKNNETGSYECAATAKIIDNKPNETFDLSSDNDIIYKVELTDDGKQFYVTVKSGIGSFN